MRTSDRKFLIADYTVNANLLSSYIAMRIGALWGSIVVIGFLGTISYQTEGSTKIVANIGLLLATSISIRIIGAIQRNLYTRCLHLARVEDALSEIGFYSCWYQLVKRNARDMSSHAIILAARTMNYGIVAYVLSNAIQLPYLVKGRGLPFIAVLFASLTLTIINERFIKLHLSENGFLDRVTEQFDESRAAARMNSCGIQDRVTQGL